MGYAVLVVAGGDLPPALAGYFEEGGGAVSHRDRMAGEAQHLQVVQVVPDGHDLGGADAAYGGEPLEGDALRAARRENVQDAEVLGGYSVRCISMRPPNAPARI